MEYRVKCWDAAVAKRAAAADGAKDAQPIKITLPDGKVIDGIAGVTTPLDIAKGISNSLAEKILVAKVSHTAECIEQRDNFM
jgi:threonyl-tRNA synthetase